MKIEERIERKITSLQDEAGILYGHKFRITEEYIISDERGRNADLKEIAFMEIYENEMLLYLMDSNEMYLLAYEGIEKLNVS